jgi:hypothetical protein
VAANPELVDHVLDRRAREGEHTSHESGERRGAKIEGPWDSRSAPIRQTVPCLLLSGEESCPVASSSNGSEKQDAWST